MTRASWRRRAAFGVSLLAIGCGGGNPVSPPPPPPPPPGPTPGWLPVRLTSPNTDDGGVLFLVRGGTIDTLRTVHPQLILRRETNGAVRVVVIGALGSGVVAEVLVPDTRQATGYSAELVQVATRTTFAQRAIGDYSIAITP